jgi:hypothetical protein
MLTGLDRQAKQDHGQDGHAKAVDRLCKILPRLAASNDAEALQATRALCRGLAELGYDFHDLADAVQKLFEVEAPKKAVTWAEMSAAAQGRWLMKLAKAEFLDAGELDSVCRLADRHCLVPGQDKDHAKMMDDLLKRWREKYHEA